jgi:hypothetical protein
MAQPATRRNAFQISFAALRLFRSARVDTDGILLATRRESEREQRILFHLVRFSRARCGTGAG